MCHTGFGYAKVDRLYKPLNPEISHIAGKNNAMADMLSRARFEDESDMISEDETSLSTSSKQPDYLRKIKA